MLCWDWWSNESKWCEKAIWNSCRYGERSERCMHMDNKACDRFYLREAQGKMGEEGPNASEKKEEVPRTPRKNVGGWPIGTTNDAK